MSAQIKDGGPVDVLAVLDRLIGNARTMAGMTGDPVMRDNLRDGEKARATVAELIEAVIENREAEQAFANNGEPDNYRRWDASERRLLAALARFGGAK